MPRGADHPMPARQLLLHQVAEAAAAAAEPVMPASPALANLRVLRSASVSALIFWMIGNEVPPRREAPYPVSTSRSDRPCSFIVGRRDKPASAPALMTRARAAARLHMRCAVDREIIASTCHRPRRRARGRRLCKARARFDAVSSLMSSSPGAAVRRCLGEDSASCRLAFRKRNEVLIERAAPWGFHHDEAACRDPRTGSKLSPVERQVFLQRGAWCRTRSRRKRVCRPERLGHEIGADVARRHRFVLGGNPTFIARRASVRAGAP